MGRPLGVDLTGRRAVITGAAGDIGWSIALAFEASGARVALVDRDLAALHARTEPLKRRFLCIQADIADSSSAARSVADAVEAFGGLDILVNNAAAEAARATVDVADPDEISRMISVGLIGAFNMARAAIPHMRSQRRGVILAIASQLAHVSAPGSAAYSAAKAGLIAMTRSLAVDHAGHGIRAVSLSPGAILTSRLERLFGSGEKAEAALAPLYPLGRIGTAQEVADAALFLVSDHASFITGVDLIMDGGYAAV